MRLSVFVIAQVLLALIVVNGVAWGDVWINEFHYDNASTDQKEFVEIAGAAGTDLTDLYIQLYNGNGGGTYNPNVTVWYLSDGTTQTSTIPDEGDGFGTVWSGDLGSNKIQNGAPDGMALIDDSGSSPVVIQFISYEGSFSATNGPANGMTSENIGVSEGSGTPVGYSLQLTGTGDEYGDFSWQSPAEDSPGSINAGQTITTAVTLDCFKATGYSNHNEIFWSTETEINNAGFHVWRSGSETGPYTRLTSQLIPAKGGTSWGADYTYADANVLPGSSFYYKLEDIDYTSQSTFHGPALTMSIDTLECNLDQISMRTGATIHFSLLTGAYNSNRDYTLLGSRSGTAPGTLLPGHLILPLNIDRFTRSLFVNANASWCPGFLGATDIDGLGSARLMVPAAVGQAGTSLSFAFVLRQPIDFVSTPVSVVFVP